MAQIASLHTYAAWISQYRQNAFCVQEHSPGNCAMSRLVNVQSCSVCSVPSGYSARSTISRSVSTKGAVAYPTADHSIIRKTLSFSVKTLRAGCGQGRNLSIDRRMPFKRSSLLWLAGAFIISAVAAQSAHGKVSSLIGHAIYHLARPNLLAHLAGLANSRSILVIGIEQTNSNTINWTNVNKEPCQHHCTLSPKG